MKLFYVMLFPVQFYGSGLTKYLQCTHVRIAKSDSYMMIMSNLFEFVSGAMTILFLDNFSFKVMSIFMAY